MSHMSHINRFNPRKVKELNPLNLKKHTYYVVWVSFNGANPKHKAIFHHRYDGHGILLNASYDEIYDVYYLSLNKFEVIEEITAMNDIYGWEAKENESDKG